MPQDVATAIVTKDELLELADAERKYAEAKKKESAAKKQVEFQRQRLAEKVLGVKSSDELKQLPPEKVQRLYAKRLERGEWEPGKNAPAFKFVKTNQGSYPSWKELYVEAFNQSKADEIAAETPMTYSYAVEVAATD
jgi:hypothetical protein